MLSRSLVTTNLMLGPRWGLIPRLTGRLTVDRNVTLALTSELGVVEENRQEYELPSSTRCEMAASR
jgi:hypothetical protein